MGIIYASVDLPAPVAPAMAIVSPGFTLNEILDSASRPSGYLKLTFSKRMPAPIPGTDRVVISENFKINNKSCKRIGENSGKRWEEPIKNGHWMAFADCFQQYNSKILKFIESKI